MANRNGRLRKAVTLGLATAAALAGSAGWAQQQTPTPTPGLAEIIVTAQKREQNIQDVPISVIALDSQQLQDAGVKDIKNMQVLTPGLTVTSTTSENVTTARIRGIGTVGDNPGLESSVGVVIDGVYRPRNGVGFGDLGEIDRIEVLEGPQGELFGKNNDAGVINIVTMRPSNTFGVAAEAVWMPICPMSDINAEYAEAKAINAACTFPSEMLVAPESAVVTTRRAADVSATAASIFA